jgi:hypothetical protein
MQRSGTRPPSSSAKRSSGDERDARRPSDRARERPSSSSRRFALDAETQRWSGAPQPRSRIARRVYGNDESRLTPLTRSATRSSQLGVEPGAAHHEYLRESSKAAPSAGRHQFGAQLRADRGGFGDHDIATSRSRAPAGSTARLCRCWREDTYACLPCDPTLVVRADPARFARFF